MHKRPVAPLASVATSLSIYSYSLASLFHRHAWKLNTSFLAPSIRFPPGLDSTLSSLKERFFTLLFQVWNNSLVLSFQIEIFIHSYQNNFADMTPSEYVDLDTCLFFQSSVNIHLSFLHYFKVQVVDASLGQVESDL